MRSIIKKIPGAVALYTAIVSRTFGSLQGIIASKQAEIDRLRAERDAILEKLEAAQMLTVTTEIERDFAVRLLSEKGWP